MAETRDPAAVTTALSEDDSPLGIRTRWVVDLLSPSCAAVDTDVASGVVPAFLDKHPEGLAALLERWRAAGPFTVVSYMPVAHKSWVQLADPTGAHYSLHVVIDSNGLARVIDLRPEVKVPPLESWADLDAVLTMPGITYSALVARMEQGRCVPLHETAADRLMPTGSGFKLYVMRALVRAVEAGEVRWDDEVTMRPTLRSLPSGEMQDLPDGARVSVRDTAYRMIAMSDNTAADAVIDLVGREAVERAVVESGHQRPEVLRPFLSTRELFEIGWGDPALLSAWVAADEDGRRALLRRVEHPLTVTLKDLVRPVHHLGLDWFMSAYDILRVLVGVWEDGARDETVRHILTAYPGVPIDRRLWPASTFKGGSCPGVMMFCWLLENHEGVPHVVVLQQAAADQELVGDGRTLRGIGGQIINNLLAR